MPRRHAVKSPSLLIVGEVAALAPQLSWCGQCIDEQGQPAPAGKMPASTP